jgi:hypothetical protein
MTDKNRSVKRDLPILEADHAEIRPAPYSQPRAAPPPASVTSGRGSTVLTLTLDNVGTVEVTLEQLLRPKRFAKAVLKQTGAVVVPPPAHAWRLWLTTCVRQARAMEGVPC